MYCVLSISFKIHKYNVKKEEGEKSYILRKTKYFRFGEVCCLSNEVMFIFNIFYIFRMIWKIRD